MFDDDPRHAKARPAPARVGAGGFRYRHEQGRWEWSGEVAALHGYPARPMQPSAAQVHAHQHPEDRAAVADTLAAAARTDAPFSGRHRILDTAGTTHHVLIVGQGPRDPNAAAGVTGFYLDITDTVAAERRHALDVELPEVLAAREAIEQVKGALMLVYGLTADQAFAVLQWRSQQTNTKLRDLAEHLAAALTALGGVSTDTRTRFEHLLLTAHDRTTTNGSDRHPR